MKFESIEMEIKDRDTKEKRYTQSDAFGFKMLNMYNQVLGTAENKVSFDELNNETLKEMLKIYRDVLSNDIKGQIIEDDRLKVVKSLESSVNSIAYEYLTKEELSNLTPGDSNSFLISGKFVASPGEDNHNVGLVIKKDQDGNFILSIVDKEKIGGSQIHTYTIEDHRINELAELMEVPNSSQLINHSDFLGKLKTISKYDEAKPYTMAQQKTGNCYVKEGEAALKFALWSKNPEGIKIKWPISTLDMHQKFTDELVTKLEKMHYKGLTEIIKINFEEYKSRKKEVDPIAWKKKKSRIKRQLISNKFLKNNEPFSEKVVRLLADKEYLADISKTVEVVEAFNQKLDELSNEELILRQDYTEKEKKCSLGHKDELEPLTKQRDNAKSILDSHLEKTDKYIDSNMDKFNATFETNEFRNALNLIKELREKHPYFFRDKQPEPRLSKLPIAQRISNAIEEAEVKNTKKFLNPLAQVNQDVKMSHVDRG